MVGYETIIWDWNGTLLDDGQYSIDIINRMLHKRGLPILSYDEHRRLFDFPVRDYYERVGFDVIGESFEDVSSEFVTSYNEDATSCPLATGASDLLLAMGRSGCRQVILSASRQQTLEEMVSSYSLAHHFEEMLGINSIHAPGKVTRGCRWMETQTADKDTFLMIGDTFHDHEVAHEMGIECWLVASGHHCRTRLESANRRIFNSLQGVAEKLLGSGS